MAVVIRTPRDRLQRVLAIATRALRFWWLGAIVAGLGTAAAIGAATLKKRQYTSETVILYREGIRSSYVLGRDAEVEAARKLGLRLKEMVLARPRLQLLIDQLGVFKDIADSQGNVVAIDQLRTNITFKVREGDTFLLSFTAPDPEMAQKVTAHLADSLVEENMRYRLEQADLTRKFLTEEKDRREADLRERETTLAQFLAKHPEFAQDQAAAMGQGGAAVRDAAKRKGEGGGSAGDPIELALMREASRLRQRLALTTGEKPKPVIKPQVDPRLVAEVNDAEANLIQARRDLQDKQARLTDQHPDVMAAKTRVKNGEDRVRRAKEALAAGELIMPEIDAPAATEAERPKLEERLRKVEAELAEVRRRKAEQGDDQAAAAAGRSKLSQEIVELETEWAKSNRDLAEARERYQSLESKEFVAEMAARSGQAAQMVIVDPAFRPVRPAGGGRMKLVILGFIASCALAGAVVVAAAIFDDRLYDKADVDELGIAPFLVAIPRPSRSSRFGGKRSPVRG
jgi:uncharacterized protein involved in exopolysaccharide biosynthesis